MGTEPDGPRQGETILWFATLVTVTITLPCLPWARGGKVGKVGILGILGMNSHLKQGNKLQRLS